MECEHELPIRPMEVAKEIPVPYQELEEVYVTSDLIEASVVTGILEQGGLNPRIRDMTVRPYPVSVGPLGEKRIAVPDDQADEARHLLETAAVDGILAQDKILPPRDGQD